MDILEQIPLLTADGCQLLNGERQFVAQHVALTNILILSLDLII